MTTSRISHRACNHLATNAERTACRKALAASRALTAAMVAADRACAEAEARQVDLPLCCDRTGDVCDLDGSLHV
jgi:hypothetical protein